MKKLLLIYLCLFLCITSCIKNYYYDNRIVNEHNFPYPKTLLIDTTNIRLLTDSLFNANNKAYRCDTINLHRLNREMEIELTKRIKKMHYEKNIRWGSDEKLDTAPLFVNSFFLNGKLDLQPDVKSLILLEYDGWWDNSEQSYIVYKTLWLINIKDNKLYSIVRLDDYSSFSICGTFSYCFDIIALKNKVFTKTQSCAEHASNEHWESETTSQFRVNEEGYIEFIEPSSNKRIKK